MIFDDDYETLHPNRSRDDSRLITASSYLKGLHHGDRPTELMPMDAIYLKAARRFYDALSLDDRNLIDSYSNKLICSGVSPKQRSKRFTELVQLFVYQMEKYHYLKPPKQAEKGT